MIPERIFVVGHRNPDTDSICSAIGYAELRRLQGLPAEPARAGALNRQTEFVLETLGREAPPLLVDVFPRVRDVIGERLITIEAEAPLTRALELFHRHGIRLLPVVDGERGPLGLLVLKNLADRFLIPGKEEEIRRVETSPAAIRSSLQAKALHLADEDAVEKLSIYVGAMAAATFRRRIAGADPRSLIVITGDRQEVQRHAVELGVRVLIVTGGLPVSPAILEQGRERGVTILSTSFDTANSSWLTRLSTPVGCLVGKDFPAVKLDDRLEELRSLLFQGRQPGALVLDGEGRVAAVATKSNLLAPSAVKLVLVDHNELSQAVPGAEKVEILEVVDHHRLGNFQTEQPIRFINLPVGSTCSVVARLFQESGRRPAAQTAGLLLAGLLSDTVLLKSPTTTPLDRELADWLGEAAGLDPLEFGKRMFAASSSLRDFSSPRELVLGDFKEYEVEGCRFGIGQVEVVGFHEFRELRPAVAEALEALRRERDLDLAALLVTDIVQETSLLETAGSSEIRHRLGYPRIEGNLFELRGVLSRKKQLLPHLLRVLRREG